MRELTKKRRTEKAEARFVGKAENILKLRRLAREYDLIDITDTDISGKDSSTAVDLEELFPELVENSGGVAIRGYRFREGLTQKQLAELTGISQHHISAMENGKSPIGKERAKKLAVALNCDYRRFL
jgi:DNA-binding XRE family transcriptional regulator